MGMIGNSLAQGLISGANIQDGTVDTPDIKDGAVTAAKIASAVVTPAKMDFSAGTANGVLYLNGSKVASSGSALVFDGTNVGIGTSSPSYKLDVNGVGNFQGVQVGTNGDSIRRSGDLYTVADGAYSLIFQTNATERMRIDSSGNVGIGTSSPGYKLTLLTATTGNVTAATWSDGVTDTGYLGIRSGGGVGLWAGGFLAFGAGSGTFSEKARIDSSGNFFVGKASTSTLGVGSYLSAAGGWFCSGTSSTNFYHVYDSATANVKFYVTGTGTINAVATTITGISDVRLKENIRDLDDGLEKVMALQPRKFDWREGKGADIKNARGFIAQEFETVFPDMVEQWLDDAPDGEEPYKAVNANLIPTLVKAIQEQQAIIEALTTRITALETP